MFGNVVHDTKEKQSCQLIIRQIICQTAKKNKDLTVLFLMMTWDAAANFRTIFWQHNMMQEQLTTVPLNAYAAGQKSTAYRRLQNTLALSE